MSHPTNTVPTAREVSEWHTADGGDFTIIGPRVDAVTYGDEELVRWGGGPVITYQNGHPVNEVAS